MTNSIVTEYKWKDAKAWQDDYNVQLSTPSDEAAKMLDAFTVQYLGWYNDESLDGLQGTMKRMKVADPEYVMVAVLESSSKLLSHKPETCPELEASLKEMEDLVEKNSKTITEWEMKQVEVVRQYAQGYRRKAVDLWCEMIVMNPFDVLSLREAYLTGIVAGMVNELKPVFDKVVPFWKPSMPMYGYVQGIYAFILNETYQHEEAEKYAKTALDFNPSDIWSVHATAHILDNTTRAADGIKFMEKSVDNWKPDSYLLGHTFWHWALFHFDQGDYESALGVFDDHLSTKFSPGADGVLRDGASLLHRLNLEGVPVGQRWHEVNKNWGPSEHAWAFCDVHMAMGYLGEKNYEAAELVIEASKDFARKGKGSNWEATKDVAVPLCEGLMALEKEQYEDAVELIYPIFNDIKRIGGSNSQRDVFEISLLHAAIRSPRTDHRKIASQLMLERKQRLGETGVTFRIEELTKRLQMDEE